MNKHIVAAVAVALPIAALADSFTALQRPMPPPARFTCAATGFSEDGLSITGKCQQSIPGVGRYVQPARYIHDVTWDLTGALTADVVTCISPAHMGIDHSGCPTMVTFSDTGTVVVIDGIPFWLAGVDALGDEAVNNQTDAYFWQP
jgi:hypothetical protein